MNIQDKMLKRLVGTTLPPAPGSEYEHLLEQAISTKSEIEALEARLRELKDELVAVCQAYDIEGFHANGYCVRVRQQTRTCLKKELLLEHGVDPDVIKAATVESEPFYVVDIRKLS